MGTLKPGAEYIYERANDTIYAREVGTTKRIVVGHNYEKDPLDHRNYMSDPKESQLWHDIRCAAMDDKEIEILLERVKILYYLKYGSDKIPKTLDW